MSGSKVVKGGVAVAADMTRDEIIASMVQRVAALGDKPSKASTSRAMRDGEDLLSDGGFADLSDSEYQAIFKGKMPGAGAGLASHPLVLAAIGEVNAGLTAKIRADLLALLTAEDEARVALVKARDVAKSARESAVKATAWHTETVVIPAAAGDGEPKSVTVAVWRDADGALQVGPKGAGVSYRADEWAVGQHRAIVFGGTKDKDGAVKRQAGVIAWRVEALSPGGTISSFVVVRDDYGLKPVGGAFAEGFSAWVNSAAGYSVNAKRSLVLENQAAVVALTVKAD